MNDNGVIDMSYMLSTDIFSFGEMLSSAAQWPESPNVDSVNKVFDESLNGLGVTSDAYMDL